MENLILAGVVIYITALIILSIRYKISSFIEEKKSERLKLSNLLEWMKNEPEFNIDDVNEILDDYEYFLKNSINKPKANINYDAFWRCNTTKRMVRNGEICFKKNKLYKQVKNKHSYILIDERNLEHDITSWLEFFNLENNGI